MKAFCEASVYIWWLWPTVKSSQAAAVEKGKWYLNGEWNTNEGGDWVYRYQIKLATTEQLRVAKKSPLCEVIKLKQD